jgi:hypothetical protein
MKKIIYNKIELLSFLAFLFTLTFSSCKKDSDGSPEVKPGNPVLESITPDKASGGTLLILRGTGLGDMRSIVFEKDSIPTYLMPTLNTETAILFRVPGDAIGGPQNIILVNSEGKTLLVPFNVQAFPQVNTVSNYDFTEGSQITLTGTNLNDVTDVLLTGTTDHATIVSQNKTTMVVKMPATTAARATLDVTNVTGTTTTSMEFVSITNSFIMYTDAWGPGAYNSGVQSWSYGCNVSETSKEFITGTKSLKVDYVDGGLSLFLGSDWGDPMHVFTQWFTPAYLTFWAKGDGKDVSVLIKTDSPPWDGTYSGAGEKIVSIPKDVWTYFKIPATTWTGKYGRLNIIISGSTNRSVYFDDLLFIK